MPTTLTSRPAHSECRDSSSGISLRQGAHQVAQKLMIKDLPPKDAMEVVLPARSASENCGSRSGILGGGNAPPAGTAPSGACAKSLGLGALASPAGTGTPRWLWTAPPDEWNFAPAQTPNTTSMAAPMMRRADVFMAREGRACVPCAVSPPPKERQNRRRGWPHPSRDAT